MQSYNSYNPLTMLILASSVTYLYIRVWMRSQKAEYSQDLISLLYTERLVFVLNPIVFTSEENRLRRKHFTLPCIVWNKFHLFPLSIYFSHHSKVLVWWCGWHSLPTKSTTVVDKLYIFNVFLFLPQWSQPSYLALR